jgi:hypothetical protein
MALIASPTELAGDPAIDVTTSPSRSPDPKPPTP